MANTPIYTPTEEDFEAWLDESQPEIIIGDRRFYHSVILKKCDPEYYQELFEQYCDDFVMTQIDQRESEPQPRYTPIAFLCGNTDAMMKAYEDNCNHALYPVSI